MIVIEPGKDGKKLIEHFNEGTKKVGIFFWHGIGDLIMFLEPYHQLCCQYPDIKFTMILPLGLGQEDLVPDALLVRGEETVDFSGEQFKDFDIICRTNFPMNEGQIEYTKGEWCCLHELGIPPAWGHRPTAGINRLVSVHFQITCLPDAANCPPDIAELVWNEILTAGFIPIECHFQHAFHNPVNVKYDFIDSTVRRCVPRVNTLLGLLQASCAFIGIVSGPFHAALSVLPYSRVFLLERDFKKQCFTKLPIESADVKQYPKGAVEKWLQSLPT